MTKREQVAAICAAAGISERTFYKRVAAGQDPAKPAVNGTARARKALSKSPWRQGIKLRGSTPRGLE